MLMAYTASTFPMSAAERKAYLAPYATPAARRNRILLLADLAGNDTYFGELEHALRTRLNHLPVLLMWRDKNNVPEFFTHFQRIYPSARTLMIPGGHHVPFAEAPDQMMADMRYWWSTQVVAREQQRVS